MTLIGSSPNRVIREMTPKGKVIRECTENSEFVIQTHPFQTLHEHQVSILERCPLGESWLYTVTLLDHKKRER